jgi:catechol 2,3-dioxygenase-like lactoylglutathione lyase family enzyme
MLLHHIGIFNKDEHQAVTFYHDFLGMEKVREYVVTPELSQQLFSVAHPDRICPTFACTLRISQKSLKVPERQAWKSFQGRRKIRQSIFSRIYQGI